MKIKPVRVHILTEGGSNIGMGHIARCNALCEAFLNIGIEATIIVDNESSIGEIIGVGNHILFNWVNNEEALLAKIDLTNSIVIVDSYKVDKPSLLKLSLVCNKIAYIDDHGRLDYPKGLLLVPINFMKYLNIPYNRSRDMLNGKEYILLRKPFWNYRSKRSINEEIEQVMIMMGGMDLKNLSSLAIELVHGQYPTAQIHLVFNKDLLYVQEWKERLGSRLSIIKGVSALEMRELMSQMDIAIVTAGQSAYELMSTGIPTIQISVAENQIWAIHAIKDIGYLDKVIDSNENGFEETFRSNLIDIKSKERRSKMREIGQKEIDGIGATRLAQDILKYFNKWEHE